MTRRHTIRKRRSTFTRAEIAARTRTHRAISGEDDISLLDVARMASVQMQDAIELLTEYAETDLWAESIRDQLERDEAALRATIARTEKDAKP